MWQPKCWNKISFWNLKRQDHVKQQLFYDSKVPFCIDTWLWGQASLLSSKGLKVSLQPSCTSYCSSSRMPLQANRWFLKLQQNEILSTLITMAKSCQVLEPYFNIYTTTKISLIPQQVFKITNPKLWDFILKL